jgi:hypothetical protein
MLFGLAGFTYFKFRSRESLDSVATRAFRTILEGGDEAELYGMIWPMETKQTGITQESLSKMLIWARSCWRGYQVKGPGTVEPAREGMAITKAIDMEGNGTRVAMPIMFYAAEEGPRFFTIQIVCTALWAKYGPQFRSLPEEERVWFAIAEGASREREALKSFSRGVCQSSIDKPAFASWEEFAAKSRSIAEMVKARH